MGGRAQEPKSVVVARAWHDQRFAAGVAAVAVQLGWQVTFLDRYGGHRWFMPQRIDGAIAIINDETCNRDLIPRLNDAGAPLVNGHLLRPRGLTAPLAHVAPDHRAIGRLAARHLHEAGHRHLAYYRGKDNEVGEQRGAAFRDEAARLGCVVHDFPRQQAGDAPRVREALSGLPHPLAVFCACDELAVMISDACRAAGLLVPEQVAILGVGDDPLLCAANQPPLSSVDIAEHEQGRQSALALDALMRGRGAPGQPALVQPAGVSPRRSSDRVVVGDEQFLRAIAFLRDHLDRDRAIAALVRELPMSRAKLYRLFVRYQGRTPASELLRLRVARAQQLLATTEQPIAAVARQAGLRDAPRLCRVFKARIGVTPGAYRRRMLGR